MNINRIYRGFNADERDNLYVPSYNSVRSILQRAKTVNKKPNPQIFSDIPDEDESYYTVDDDPFMRHKEEDFMIFASTTQLQTLINATEIFIDGTFFVCPIVYYQLVLKVAHSKEYYDQFY